MVSKVYVTKSINLFWKKAIALFLCLFIAVTIIPVHTVEASDLSENTDVEFMDEGSNKDSIDIQDEIIEKDSNDNSSLGLQYVYMENSYIDVPGVQKIAMSFDQEDILGVSLYYEREDTNETYQTQALEIKDSAALFEISFSDIGQTGIYHLKEIKVTIENEEHNIALDDLGINCKFGVNQECITDPDAIVEEESSTIEVDENVNTAYLTLDEKGELSESNQVEEVIAEAMEDVQLNVNIARSRKASNEKVAKNVVIVLDPGHGGYDGGAKGNGVNEKDLTLKIAKYCKEELEQYYGVVVYMTRETDEYIGLSERVNFAKSKNADIFVSIHLNAANGKASGAEVYYPNNNYSVTVGNEGKKLAQEIQNELVALGLTDRKIKIRNSDDGSKYPDGSLADYYSVIYGSKQEGFPGIIVEHAFIDSGMDYNNYLSSDAKLQKLGLADATGIANYFKLLKGTWIQDNRGWWFQCTDGTWPSNGLFYVGGYWYYFDKNGYRQSGMVKIGNNSYYFDEDGRMTIGWKKLDDVWYYFDDSGVMKKGWLLDGSIWYFLDNDGKMVTGWKEINGYAYYFGPSGNMYVGTCTIDNEIYEFRETAGGIKIGWYKSGNNWYYIKSDFTKATGFLKLGNNTYYMEPDGKMITGRKNIDGIWYYFQSSGLMKRDGWLLLDGVWYYLEEDGKMAIGWREINGYAYFFGNEGNMYVGTCVIENETYEFRKTAGGIKIGWYKSGNDWYYIRNDFTKATGFLMLGNNIYFMEPDGKMVTGWKKINEIWYYFQSSGLMKKDDWLLLEGVWYYLDTDGKMVTGWKVINGYAYYFGSSGNMYVGTCTIDNQIYEFRKTAGGIQLGWFKSGNDWYYMKDDFTKATGFLELGKNTYYLEENGKMVIGWKNIEGTWYYFNKSGLYKYSGVTDIMGETLLGIDRETAVTRMVNMYMKNNSNYPGDALAKGGAPNIRTFCELIYDEAVFEGIKPEVVFGQVMKETGYLRFGGDVKVEQFNFAGLGATGGGNPGNSFRSVQIGLRAQVQHLKAYASKEPLKNVCEDVRFNKVERNSAPYVEWLGIQENPYGKGWAAAYEYGFSLMDAYIRPLYLQ